MAYIGFFPTSPGFQAINFKMDTNISSTSTVSGRTIRVQTGTTLWSGTLRFPPMTLAEFLPIKGFLARCKGSLNEFDLIMPTISQSSQGYGTDDYPGPQLTVAVAASAGATSVTVNSQLYNIKVLNPGDVIRFPNHTKVYMVTNNDGVTADSGGQATINFEPELVTAVPVADSTGGDYIQMAEVPFRMNLVNNVQEMNYTNDGLIAYELDVQEVL